MLNCGALTAGADQGSDFLIDSVSFRKAPRLRSPPDFAAIAADIPGFPNKASNSGMSRMFGALIAWIYAL